MSRTLEQYFEQFFGDMYTHYQSSNKYYFLHDLISDSDKRKGKLFYLHKQSYLTEDCLRITDLIKSVDEHEYDKQNNIKYLVKFIPIKYFWFSNEFILEETIDAFLRHKCLEYLSSRQLKLFICKHTLQVLMQNVLFNINYSQQYFLVKRLTQLKRINHIKEIKKEDLFPFICFYELDQYINYKFNNISSEKFYNTIEYILFKKDFKDVVYQ